MKTNPLLVMLSACAVSVAAAGDWDFSYGYRDVFATNADAYVVSRQHVRKYSEWQDPPVTYWGPSANDTPGVLTERFDFPAPTARAFLKARISGSNQGMHSGSASLWASPDGTAWQMLLDSASADSSDGSDLTYNQEVPASLLGSTSLWLQLRMRAHGTLTSAPDLAASWTDAQFSRRDSSEPGNIFELDASYARGLRAVICRLGVTGKTAKLWAGIAGGMLLCLLGCWALVRRTRRERLYHHEVLERLDAIDARLGALERGPNR